MSLTLPRGAIKPIVWSIAGSDSSAGAGLQTDLKTLTALGAHACTIVTSVTAQSSGEVFGIESAPPTMLAAQIDALRNDMPPAAIKIGMLGSAEGVRVIAEKLAGLDAFTIYDPVMIATSGKALLGKDTLVAMWEKLLPCIDLLTPNLAEAETLSGITIREDEDIIRAAEAILKIGVKSVLIKGWDCGHGFMQDYFCGGDQNFWLTLPKHPGAVPRGTGCTLSSTLAAAHAFGFEAADAAVIAKAYVHRCLRQNKKLGKGPPIADYAPWPVEEPDFPCFTATAEAGRNRPVFPACGAEPLGFYPVVDSLAWLERILPLGVRTAQLRVKNLTGVALENEIRQAIVLARTHGTRLFINDYWQLAMQHGAYGVHLGQEDLQTADMAALTQSGMRLGVSTHSYAELARALALRPSYIALGPIFPTTLKSMKVAPQGIETLEIWRALTALPLVAIGGITLEQAAEIYAAGADSIAVVSDVTQNRNPVARVEDWLKLTEMRERLAGEDGGLAAIA